MGKRDIIVIGASAGGVDAFTKLCKDLPKNFEASVFIVWHMAPSVKGVLPQILNQAGPVPAAHAVDNEPILPGRIYIAPPDYHMLLEEGRVRVSHGPKENRFRPAVDPLFRSAAYIYGNRVIGVVLSGALDDGTAGLWTIKYRGGTAVVQDPEEAEVPSMPSSAIREVEVDHIVPSDQMAPLLMRLSAESVPEETKEASMKEEDKTKAEISIALEDNAFGINIPQFGTLTPYTCPECHGVLTMLKDGNISRFRCHTGHAYSAETLLEAVNEGIEDSLYSAIRGVDESVILLNHLGDHFAEANQLKMAAMYFRQAKRVGERADLIRKAVLVDRLIEQPDELENGKNDA